MKTISEYYEYSELAFASYSSLKKGMQSDAFIKALQDYGKGLSPIQAGDFANIYTVKRQYNDPNGLSVTLFEDGSGNQTVAVRGTDDLNDIGTDFIDIGILGTAEHQDQYQSLSAKVEEWLGDSTLKSGFTVTGHSLGGFLATNLALEYATKVEHTYIYNAPGVTGVGGNILSAIVEALSPEKSISIPSIPSISNIIAAGDIVSDVGLYISSPIEIIVEAQSWSGAHSISGLTDTLAVYSLFSDVDTSLTISEITTIFKASTNKSDRMLESTVTSLGKLFVSGFSPRTGNEYNTNRDNLYTDIKAISNEINSTSLGIETFATADEDGNITPVSASAIESLAQIDIAYRYALVNLNPFVIYGVDYDRFNPEGELDLVSDEGQLSEDWLTDRAAMLHWKMQYDITDTDYGDELNGDIPGDWDYTDFGILDDGKPLSLKIDGNGIELTNHQVVFGTSQGDGVEGDSQSDHLYGMGGNDIIQGYGGDDYIEGGKGQDTMYGGDGTDTFYIQGEDEEYDTFNGGDGTDTILGSSGDDTIRLHNFTGANRVEIIDGDGGVDVIEGTGMSDRIDLSETTLTGIKEIRGGDRADTITGSGGNDKIYGENGHDRLPGGGGIDHLDGGVVRISYFAK